MPPGKAEKDRCVLNMARQMDKEYSGNCAVGGSCDAICPKEISLSFIAKMNRDYGVAILKGPSPKGRQPPVSRVRYPATL